MKETIFFVEDDISINSLLKATLELNGYQTQGFVYPLDFLSAVKNVVPSLIILDLMLPQMSGYEVLKKLQEDDRLKAVPVIILSALSEENDIVKGLDDGAVDYVTKPFGMNEFLSRVKANLRKSVKPLTPSVLTVRNLVVDKDKYTCTLEGKALSLTAKEFELLYLLVANKSRVVTRAELLKEIWGFSDEVETRTLDMHVKTLREKFASVTDEQYLVTVRSIGYAVYDKE